jgi:hypothetical protein
MESVLVTIGAGIAQSISQMAMGWTVWGPNPGGGEIFRTCPDRPWGPPSLLYNEYWVFPGGKVAGARCWPPTPLQHRSQETVELYLYPPLWVCYGVPLPLSLLVRIMDRQWVSKLRRNLFSTILSMLIEELNKKSINISPHNKLYILWTLHKMCKIQTIYDFTRNLLQGVYIITWHTIIMTMHLIHKNIHFTLTFHCSLCTFNRINMK